MVEAEVAESRRQVRLLLVDDHKLLRMGLVDLFATVGHFAVVGEAGTAREAVAEARRCQPDVVILDVRLPDGSAVEACRQILAERPSTRILMLTSYDDEEMVRASLLAGATGYFLKEVEPERLIQAVELVAEGSLLVDPAVTPSLLTWLQRVGQQSTGGALSSLREQERKILLQLAEGKTNREIAAELCLSEHTVKTYVSDIFRKLHLARRSEAAAFLVRQNEPLLPPFGDM